MKTDTGNRVKFSGGAIREHYAPMYHLIFPDALRRLGLVHTKGHMKYGPTDVCLPENAKTVSKDFVEDTLNHAIEHIYKHLSGDKSEDHLAHAAWNLFTRMHFEELSCPTTPASSSKSSGS